VADERLRARLRAQVVLADPPAGAPVRDLCWLWQGWVNERGYGTLAVEGQTRRAHRVSYEEYVGPIPEGHELDHLCRTRHCINPGHLEPVSHEVNVQRAAEAGRRAGGGMTKRRWAREAVGDDALGPVEAAAYAELEGLGFTPLTPPGPLRTAAQRALALAETFDRTMNAGYLPALDRQLATVMAEARQAAGPNPLKDHGTPGAPPPPPDDEVVDFEERRRRQRGGN
jgi:hypothetical protein